MTVKKRHASAGGFTLVEVMMASLILVVGFIGLIEAVTLASNTMDHARRQTLATQIVNHEIEKLRFSSWTTISALPTPGGIGMRQPGQFCPSLRASIIAAPSGTIAA